jgi:hypothetical protein
MSGTLTVPAAALEAVARGDERTAEWVRLLETGTDEQIAAEECWHGAMIRADVEVRRILYPAEAPRLIDLVMRGAAIASARASLFRTTRKRPLAGVSADDCNAPN